MFEVKVIADSINAAGNRLTTLALQYPRFIHSELMTHRVFSRNAMSSRAVPVAKMLAQVREAPAMPVHWGANQPGMQASVEVAELAAAQKLWINAANSAANWAEEMMELGLHKQVANRILEPFQWMRTIVSATEFDNFFELRTHKDADPNIKLLADMILDEVQYYSVPKLLKPGEWHLPYVTEEEAKLVDSETNRSDETTLRGLCKISAARCARVSYLTHDGASPDIEKDLQLFDRLAGARPLHASPLEHQGTPGETNTGNFKGWTQFRKLWENEIYGS